MKLVIIKNRRIKVFLFFTLLVFLIGFPITENKKLRDCTLKSASTDSTYELSITKVGSILEGGMVDTVVIENSYAYVADIEDGLEIIDVSDPTSPNKIKNYDCELADIFIKEDYVYVSGKGFEIIDISDPSSPSSVAYYRGKDESGVYETYPSVFILEPYAFLAAHKDGLVILDISDPSSPSRVGSLSVGCPVDELFVKGNTVYLGIHEEEGGVFAGLKMIDISTISSLEEIGSFSLTGGVYDLIILGSYAYLTTSAHGLVVLDITDSTSPIKVGELRESPSLTSYGLDINNTYAYVTTLGNGFSVMNIEDPTNPQIVGHYENDEGLAWDIVVSGSYAYMADHNDGLEIFLIENSESAKDGTYQIPGYNIIIMVYVSFLISIPILWKKLPEN